MPVNRSERIASTQEIMATRMTQDVSEIQAALQQVLNLPAPPSKPAVYGYIKAVKTQNWQWLTDTARTTYIADIRDRATDLKEAWKLNMRELRRSDLKPHARAMLVNSTAALNKEITDLIEGCGLYVHWDALVNRDDPAWQAAAQTADTSEADAALT